jgi:hypothetical protein
MPEYCNLPVSNASTTFHLPQYILAERGGGGGERYSLAVGGGIKRRGEEIMVLTETEINMVEFIDYPEDRLIGLFCLGYRKCSHNSSRFTLKLVATYGGQITRGV